MTTSACGFDRNRRRFLRCCPSRIPRRRYKAASRTGSNTHIRDNHHNRRHMRGSLPYHSPCGGLVEVPYILPWGILYVVSRLRSSAMRVITSANQILGLLTSFSAGQPLPPAHQFNL